MSITRDDWLRALAEAGESDVDDRDALTVNEFAAMLDISRQTADYKLKRLLKAGKAIRTQKIARNDYGRTLRFVAYRLTT